MKDKYTLVHEGLSQWINSPNNGGECCQTWADTVDELNRLLARIKRLKEAGDAMAEWLENPRNLGADACLSHAWREAKEAKP